MNTETQRIIRLLNALYEKPQPERGLDWHDFRSDLLDIIEDLEKLHSDP